MTLDGYFYYYILYIAKEIETRGILWLREKQHTAKQEKGQWLRGQKGAKNLVDSTGLLVRQIEDELQGAKNGIKKIKLYRSRRKSEVNSRKKCRVTKTKVPLQRCEEKEARLSEGPAIERSSRKVELRSDGGEPPELASCEPPRKALAARGCRSRRDWKSERPQPEPCASTPLLQPGPRCQWLPQPLE